MSVDTSAAPHIYQHRAHQENKQKCTVHVFTFTLKSVQVGS